MKIKEQFIGEACVVLIYLYHWNYKSIINVFEVFCARQNELWQFLPKLWMNETD